MAKKILIIDSEGDDLKAYADALREEGYEVVAVRSGKQALQLATLGQLPDLAVIQVDLPDVPGLKVAQELQSLGVSSIFVASYAQRELVAQACCEGALSYLIKPVSAEALMAAVRVALDLANELRELEMSRERLTATQELNRKISIAIGIYMAQFNLSEEQAFEEIRAYARSQRTRLATLCEEMVNAHNRVHQLLCRIKEHGMRRRGGDHKNG